VNRTPRGRHRAPHRRAAGSHWPPRALATRLLYRATRLLPVLIVLGTVGGLGLVVFSTAAYAAQAGAQLPLAAASLQAVVNNIRLWLVGILVGVATLFLTIGGLRLMWANGDPGEVEKGKAALRSAAVGYGLAMLAPLIVTIVGSWVS
jgi:hypothetical protein